MAFHDDVSESDTTLTHRDEVLQRVAAGIPHLGHRVLTVSGDAVDVTSPRERAGGAQPVRPLYRTGSTDHVQRVAGPDGDGVWISDVTAVALRIGPGDDITLRPTRGRPVKLRVAGVYRALYNAPSTPFWEPLGQQFRPPDPDAPLPPPYLLVGRDEIVPLMEKLGQSEADVRWEAPVALRPAIDLGQAETIGRDLRQTSARLLDIRSSFGRDLYCPACPVPPVALQIDYGIDEAIRNARATIASLAPGIDLLAVAGGLVALVVLGGAGVYCVNRRRVEMRWLAARGLGPATLGAKTAFETVLPCLVGGAAGFGAALLVLPRLGPSDHLDPHGLLEAARDVALALPVALVAIACAAALGVVAETRVAPSRSRLARAPWELAALALAALALHRISTSGALVEDPATGVGHPSLSALVFPVLFLAGAGGLAARAFRGLAALIRARSRGGPPSVYLAINRIASARRLAVMLVTASTLAFGTFLYAQAMVSSVRATTLAKSFVFTGSDVSVPVDAQYSVASRFPWPYTKTVEALDAGRLEPPHTSVDVLGIDPETFGRAAFWDESFSSRSLPTLMSALDGPDDGFVRVIAAGDVPDGAALEIGGVQVPYRVVARTSSFPGKYLDRTLFVVDAATVGPAVEAAGALNPLTTTGSSASLWIKGDPDGIRRSLSQLGFDPDDSIAAADVLRQPAFVSVARTFGFLKALGVMAALLVVVGTVLYIQSRQRNRAVAFALARRMGLARRSHYGALALELAWMLGVSLGAGIGLGAAASALVHSHVDLLPEIPPHPVLRVPYALGWPLAGALALVTLSGAWRAQRAADSTNVAEALRSAE